MAESTKGSRPYTPFLLTLYDWIILRFNMSYVWRCPTKKVLFPLFVENFSENHLDIGVATGYFPATALQQHSTSSDPTASIRPKQQRLALVDLNSNALHVAKERILSQPPKATVTCLSASVTEPPPANFQSERFQSISMMNLLHCLPGPTSSKLAAFKHYGKLLNDSGVLFGCTILGYEGMEALEKGLDRGWLCYYQMKLYNRNGSFDNWGDDAETFKTGLEQEFEQVETWIVGSMFLFKARNPRS